MSLKEQLEQALAAMPLFAAGDESLQASQGSLGFDCRLVELDRLGCSFIRLSLHSDRVAALSTDELKSVAGQLASKLTYLLEPISPIETDAHGCVVQLRSNPPQKETDRTTYYELLVSRTGELSLSRYARSAGQQREVIPAHITREVLLRLAGDFAGVAS